MCIYVCICVLLVMAFAVGDIVYAKYYDGFWYKAIIRRVYISQKQLPRSEEKGGEYLDNRRFDVVYFKVFANSSTLTHSHPLSQIFIWIFSYFIFYFISFPQLLSTYNLVQDGVADTVGFDEVSVKNPEVIFALLYRFDKYFIFVQSW